MILDEVKKLVSDEYDVISLIDLVPLDSASQKDIYNILQPLHKTEFKDNERIVFYYFSPLTHGFDDLPAETLIQLQKMLVYIDIPNFFCIVLTNDKNVSTELKYICEQYTVNENPIQSRVISV